MTVKTMHSFPLQGVRMGVIENTVCVHTPIPAFPLAGGSAIRYPVVRLLMARETRRVTCVMRRAVQRFGFGETPRENQRHTQRGSEQCR